MVVVLGMEKASIFFKIKMKGSTIFLIIEDSNFSDWLLFQDFKLLWIYHFHFCFSLKRRKIREPLFLSCTQNGCPSVSQIKTFR